MTHRRQKQKAKGINKDTKIKPANNLVCVFTFKEITFKTSRKYSLFFLIQIIEPKQYQRTPLDADLLLSILIKAPNVVKIMEEQTIFFFKYV